MNNYDPHSFKGNHKSPIFYSGFTLIELMVTFSIIAIMAAIAVPTYQNMIVKSNFSSIGNAFTGSILQSRSEAINKNTCISMCMSANPDSVSPTCTTTGLNWQAGWIVFFNPTCNAALTAPATAPDLISVYRTVGMDYALNTQSGSAVRSIMFNSLGNPGGGSNGRFDLVYKDISNSYTTDYAFSICIDTVGRARAYQWKASCS
jgi:type IV fimbrial biogenesis protein FimT